MGRKSAAQLAKEEDERLKAEALENGGDSGSGTATSGELVENTGDGEGAALNPDSGDSGGDGELIISGPEEDEEVIKAHAVTLRAIPGTNLKPETIIKAPEKLIGEWDSRNWVDPHENALKYAQQQFEKKATQLRALNPGAHIDEMIIELNEQGQPISEQLKG